MGQQLATFNEVIHSNVSTFRSSESPSVGSRHACTIEGVLPHIGQLSLLCQRQPPWCE